MFLYMKQSLKRRFGMHLHVFIIMLCAFILPFLLCFVRDSMVYGYTQMAYTQTNNSYYQIPNASPHHVEYFQELEDFHIIYENGTIYLQPTESFDTSKIGPPPIIDENGFITNAPLLDTDPEYVPTYDSEIFNIILRIKDAHLYVNNMVEIMRIPPYMVELSNQYWLFIVVFLMLSIIVLNTIYRIHIGNFSLEISILRCLGANQGQIMRMFFAELFILFLTSGFVALVLSYLIGYAMIEIFMRMDNINTNMHWIIYNINPTNVLIIFSIMFVFTLCVYAIIMRSIMRLSPQQLVIYSKSKPKIKHYNKKLAYKKNTEHYFFSLLLTRANKGFAQSLIVAVPAITVLILVFSYIGINTANLYETLPYDIRVHDRGDYTIGEIGFSESDFEYFDNLEGVAQLEYICYGNTDSNFIEQRGEISEFKGFSMNGKRFAPITIVLVDDISGENVSNEIRNALLENPNAVIMGTGAVWAQYDVGDTVSIFKHKLAGVGIPMDPMRTELKLQDFYEPVQLTIDALVETSFTPQAEIYVPKSIFDQLIDKSDSNVAEITLEDGVDHIQFTQMLRDDLNGGEAELMQAYNITNEREAADIRYMQNIGWFIFTGILALVVFGVVLIVLYVLLKEHMRQQRQNMALMRVLGATNKTIRRVYLRQSAVATIVGLVLSFGLGVSLSIVLLNIFSALSSDDIVYKVYVNAQYIIVIFLIAVVMVLAMNLPIIKATSTKNLQKLNFAQEG